MTKGRSWSYALGTGKTVVITRRIARLIADQAGQAGADPGADLEPTSAGRRDAHPSPDASVGWEAYRVNVMTFHAFWPQVLQRFGHHLRAGRRGPR